MLVTVIALGLAAMPIMASVNADRGDSRDQASDAALAAADAGANSAISRQTQMASFLSSSKPCVKLNGTTLEAAAAESGWCAAIGPVSVGNSTYTYRVKPTYSSSAATISVVATGTSTSGGRSVTRRLLTTASSSGSPSRTVFGTEGVVGVDSIFMTGSASIYGDVGTNGYIEWKGNPSIPGCTRARVGSPSGEFKKLSWQTYPCPRVQENREYPPPVVPATNSNSRMFTAGGDTYTYSNGALAGCGAGSGQASWCPTTKVLYLTSDATVTLGGSAPYVFCQLKLDNNTRLIMAAGTHIQIIFDSPENCGLPSGTTQMQISNSGKIVSPSYSPGIGNYSVPGFYFVGSATRTTKIVMNGAAEGNNMIIYAPRTAIEITNGASFGGAILGKSVYLDGGIRVKSEGTGTFNPDENLPIEGSGGSSTFSPGSFVECSAVPTVEAEPASGC